MSTRHSALQAVCIVQIVQDQDCSGRWAGNPAHEAEGSDSPVRPRYEGNSRFRKPHGRGKMVYADSTVSITERKHGTPSPWCSKTWARHPLSLQKTEITARSIGVLQTSPGLLSLWHPSSSSRTSVDFRVFAAECQRFAGPQSMKVVSPEVLRQIRNTRSTSRHHRLKYNAVPRDDIHFIVHRRCTMASSGRASGTGKGA